MWCMKRWAWWAAGAVGVYAFIRVLGFLGDPWATRILVFLFLGGPIIVGTVLWFGDTFTLRWRDDTRDSERPPL